MDAQRYMDLQKFRVLPARQRALVAVAVLLDGREAASYLESDAISGSSLKKAAVALAEQPPEIRMPLAGSLLRMALSELE